MSTNIKETREYKQLERAYEDALKEGQETERKLREEREKFSREWSEKWDSLFGLGTQGTGRLDQMRIFLSSSIRDLKPFSSPLKEEQEICLLVENLQELIKEAKEFVGLQVAQGEEASNKSLKIAARLDELDKLVEEPQDTS